MTAAGGLILETNLESYFHERIRDARQSLACMIADEVEFYSSDEESEDEEDFENINLDKYVDLDKSFIMECVYNNKFKMWIPEKVVKNKNIIDRRQLLKFKKK